MNAHVLVPGFSCLGDLASRSNLRTVVGGHLNLPAGGHEEDAMAITERDRIR